MREKLEKGAIYWLIWNKRDADTRAYCVFEVTGDPVTEKGSTISDVKYYIDSNEPEKTSPYTGLFSRMTSKTEYPSDTIRSTNIRKVDDFIQQITKEQAYRLVLSYVFTKMNSKEGTILLFDQKIR